MIAPMIAPSRHIQTPQNKMQCSPPWHCSHFRNWYQGKFCLSSFRILFLAGSHQGSQHSLGTYNIRRPSENQVLIWKKMISGSVFPSSWPFVQAIEGQRYNGSPRDFNTKSWIWEPFDNGNVSTTRCCVLLSNEGMLPRKHWHDGWYVLMKKSSSW